MADPKLKEAAAEISGILKKHDIAGYVMLMSETHSEFMFKLDPTWSACIVEDNTVRIRAKEKELGSKEAVHRKAESTAHMLCQMKDLSAYGFKVSDQLISAMETVYEIDHQGGKDFEPHMPS